jgi:hypothetical protein
MSERSISFRREMFGALLKNFARIESVEVQRLTASQMEVMGLSRRQIKEIGVCDWERAIVALGRNGNGEVLKARVVENVNHKKFLHEEEYFQRVLKQAEELIS